VEVTDAGIITRRDLLAAQWRRLDETRKRRREIRTEARSSV
jgi:hypothetical protein